ncbi:hypothetical protein ABPG74_017277 [Tetrahymena malaccensis]
MNSYVVEANWIRKLRQVLKQELPEETEEDKIAKSIERTKRALEKNSQRDNFDIKNLDLSDDPVSSSQSFDFENLVEENENQRSAYMKVANAFLEQDSDKSDNEIQKLNKENEKKLQKQIAHHYEQEYETEFQINKLSIDYNPVLDVVEMNVFDRIALFQAVTIFEKIYKQVWYIKEKISYICFQIVNHTLFTIISLSVIVFNSVMLAKDDPTTNTDNNPAIDLTLLIIYTTEMGLKILAMGFIFSKKSYLSEGWNVLDFIIIVTGWLPYVINSSSFNLTALRSLRVLRPLRSISKVKILNQLVTALFTAIPLLKDALIILCFFFGVFGIAGLQLFSGQLKTRCIDIYTGIKLGDENNNLFVCAQDGDCPIQQGISYICAKGMVSPNSDFYNFDTFGWSLLNVYVVVSNEGWSTIMQFVMVGFNFFAFIYFFLIVYLGTWLLVNLCMGIIAVKYSESIENQSILSTQKGKLEGYNMQNLIRWGIYKSNKILYKELDEQKKKKKNFFDLSFSMSSLLASYNRKSQKFETPQIKGRGSQEFHQMKHSKILPLDLNTQTQSNQNPLKTQNDQVKNQKEQIPEINLIEKIQITENQQEVQNTNNDEKNSVIKKQAGLNGNDNRSNGNSTPLSAKVQLSLGIIRQNSNLNQINDDAKNSNKKQYEHSKYKSDKQKTKLVVQNTEKKGYNMIVDPSILANKLEQIKTEQIQSKKTSKKLISTSKDQHPKVESSFQRYYELQSQKTDQKKMSFAPIQKQKPQQQEQKLSLKKIQAPHKEVNEGQQLSRKKSKNGHDIRRASKKQNHLFQFQENFKEEEEESDEDFLMQIENCKELNDNQGLNQNDDDLIEENYLNQIHSTLAFQSLKQKKLGEKKLQAPTSQMDKKEENNEIAIYSQSQDSKAKRNTETRSSSLNIQKKKAFTFKRGTKDISNTNKMSQNTETNSNEESLSDISEMSFLVQEDLETEKNVKPQLNRKSTMLNNMFNDLEIQVKKNKKLKIENPQKNPHGPRKSTKNVQQVEEKYETLLSQDTKNIEQQLQTKINKQIDLKAEDFRLLLDSKYLKPRVIYAETNDYTPEVLPTKLEKQRQTFLKSQDEKIKRMRFRLKFQSSAIIKKEKTKKKPLIKIPFQKSKRVEILQEDLILDAMLAGKFTTDNQSIKYSKQADQKNDMQSYDSPNPFRQTKMSGFMQKTTLNKAYSSKEEEKNSVAQYNQPKQLPFSPNINAKQIFLRQQFNFESNIQSQLDDKKAESIASKLDNFNQAGQQKDLNNSINQDLDALNSPSNKAKSVKDYSEMKDSPKAENKKQIFANTGEEKNDKSVRSSKNVSVIQSNEQDQQNFTTKMLSLRMRNDSCQSNQDQLNTSQRSKIMAKQTDKKLNTSGAIFQQKKGKNQKGDEVENSWDIYKAIQKIFTDQTEIEKDEQQGQQDDQDQKQNNIKGQKTQIQSTKAQQQKNTYDVLMYQLEQKIIKKAERQLDILNKSESIRPSQADIKSMKSIDTGLTTSNLTNDDNESTQKNNLQNQQPEVFDLEQFQQESEEYKYISQRKKDIQNFEKKGVCVLKVQTSADDVLSQSLRYKQQETLSKILDTINCKQEIIEQNEGGIIGIIQAFRRRVKRFVMHSVFENFIMLCVLLNTVVLCMDGIVPASASHILDTFNLIFTIIFAIDMGLKIIGMGIVMYASDKMNIFDAFIVSLSIFELIFLNGSSSVSALRSIRILRVFRVLRVTRLLRSLQFMKILVTAISSTLEQFIYILLLLFLIMFIYALLGMSLFGGNWPTYNSNVPSRLNYDQFINAAFAVLDLLTLENWNDQLTNCLMSNVSNYVCTAYLISMIFIGNYILLGLVLAIMLDSFNSAEVQNDRQEIENRFEVVQDLTFGHTSMGTTFMNNLSQSMMNQSSNNISRISGGIQQSSGLQRSATLSRQAINKLSQSNDSGQLDKSKSIIAGDDSSSDKVTALNSESKLKQDNKKNKNKFIWYEGVECEKSLYLFSKEGSFRKTIYYIYKHSMFEKIVLLVIILTSFKLTFDTYIGTADVKATEFSNDADLFFTIFFLCECLIKVIAVGFILDEGSYLRDNWSQLDFFIVVSSLVDLSLSSINLNAIKILRLLRTLRPLRLLSQNKSMKLIVTALMESIGGIANMIFVVLLIWLMFAILGLNLMQGKLFYCNTTGAALSGQYNVYNYQKQQCQQLPGAFWDRYPNNSDNIGFSMVMLFVLSTFEGWPNYVWYYLDGSDTGPVWNNSRYFGVFFTIFIFVGSFFSINLFTAIISFNFDIATKKAKNAFLTDDQSQWIELQRLIVKSTPDYASMKSPDNQFRKLLWRVSESPKLDVFIIICIIGNVIVMAMAYDTSSSDYDFILQSINLGFTGVFIAECIIKIIAYGIQGYFYKGWNQFDFFVVCSSVVDIIMSYSGKSFFSFLKAGPQIARVLRVLRVSRLLKLIKSFQGLQKLIQTTVFAFPKFLNATLLFILFYFIFSILAWFLFSDLQSGWRLNTFWNFSNFHRAIILLVRMSTGEDWYLVMYDTFNSKGVIGLIFFVSFYTVQSYILMNLFVLIIMNEFEENYINPDNPLSNFNEQEEQFKKRWVQMTQKDSGIKIHEKYLTEFYFELPAPLGFDFIQKSEDFVDQIKSRDNDISHEEVQSRLDRFRIRQRQEADKNIMKMNVFCDYEGYIYFNDLFYQLFKFSLYSSVYELDENSLEDPKAIQRHNTALEIMKKEEKVTWKKIGIIKKKQSSLLKAKIVLQRQQGVNPMVRRLFVGMAFKSWLQYSIKTQDNLNHINFNKDDISSQTDSEQSDDENQNEEIDNIYLDQPFDEDGIQFKKQKPGIIKREHTIISRPGGLKKYRDEHEKQTQLKQKKKYHRLPNADVYRQDKYDDKNAKYFEVDEEDVYVETKHYIQEETGRKSILQRNSILFANPLQTRKSVLQTIVQEKDCSEGRKSVNQKYQSIMKESAILESDNEQK